MGEFIGLMGLDENISVDSGKEARLPALLCDKIRAVAMRWPNNWQRKK